MLFSVLFLVAVIGNSRADSFDETAFASLVTKLEGDAFEFAREVERLYGNRCSADTFRSCDYANYRESQSAYPNQECLTGPNFMIDTCSSGNPSCAGLWDYSISTVRIPRADADGIEGNPTNPKLIESICFSRYLDEWFVEKRKADMEYWKYLGVQPRSMYFGSHTGAFRIYPARQSEDHGGYDPRTRPWYVAGSSGPKNVVLILDVSRSMLDDGRFGLMKQAAERVVSTLTVSDRVVIVPFSSAAHRPIGDNGFMMRATAGNKEILKQAIDRLEADGNTNFYDAFEVAFEVLETSVDEEYTASCNTAILFLTDGENKEGPNTTEVTNLVTTRISSISAKIGKPILLFTYSIGNDDVHLYPSQLACSVELGVWSKISRSEEIVDAFSSYYQLFALGLGSDSNENFAAWVEPYKFQTGNTVGTTISVPVYDRTKTPPLFLGVVAIDVALDALDAALATDGSSNNADNLRNESIYRVVASSDASCPPSFDLSPCVLDAYRTLGGGGCGVVNCTDIQVTQVQEEPCQTVSDHPKTLFADPRISILSYEERVCCLVGETVPSDQCFAEDEDDDPPIAAIAGGVAAGVVAIFFCACVYFYVKKEKNHGESSDSKNNEQATNADTTDERNYDNNHCNPARDSPQQNVSMVQAIPVPDLNSAPRKHMADAVLVAAEIAQ